MYVVGSYVLLSRITALERSQFFTESIGLFGGIIVFIIGIGMVLNKPKELDFNQPLKNSKTDAVKSFVQGFSVNTFNPFTITFWTGAVSTSIAHEGWMTAEHLIFLATVMVIIICTDSLKVYFANYIRKHISSSLIRKINKGAGILVLICGIYLIAIYLNL